MNIFSATPLWLGILFVAEIANAETLQCSRKLSVLSADVETMSQRLSVLSEEVALVARRFDDDEEAFYNANAKNSVVACPDEMRARMDGHRHAIGSLPTEDQTRVASDDLVCAQHFDSRVQTDMDKARSAGNARMVERLLTISKKISGIEVVATRHATEAAFLQSKKLRLLQGVEQIEDVCNSLGGYN